MCTHLQTCYALMQCAAVLMVFHPLYSVTAYMCKAPWFLETNQQRKEPSPYQLNSVAIHHAAYMKENHSCSLLTWVQSWHTVYKRAKGPFPSCCHPFKWEVQMNEGTWLFSIRLPTDPGKRKSRKLLPFVPQMILNLEVKVFHDGEALTGWWYSVLATYLERRILQQIV